MPSLKQFTTKKEKTTKPSAIKNKPELSQKEKDKIISLYLTAKKGEKMFRAAVNNAQFGTGQYTEYYKELHTHQEILNSLYSKHTEILDSDRVNKLKPIFFNQPQIADTLKLNEIRNRPNDSSIIQFAMFGKTSQKTEHIINKENNNPDNTQSTLLTSTGFH